MPVSNGSVGGMLAPAGINTVGVTMATEWLVVVSVTVTPPAGAGPGKATGSGTVWPALTVKLEGRLRVIASDTWICRLAGAYPGADAVTVENPSLRISPPAVIRGCVAGVSAPPAMKTLGVTVNLEGSLLTSVTVMPPGGAGTDKLTGRSTAWVIPTAWKTGRITVGALTTVTVATVVGKKGGLLAVITAEPSPTLVTGTFTLLVPAANITVDADSVATLVLLEPRLNVRPPAGAGADRAKVRLWTIPVPVITRVAGWKLTPALTDTCWLADPRPGADAVIVATPKPTPVTLGGPFGVVAPCGMKMVAGDMVTFEVSLLVRFMKAPPAGAPVAKVTGESTVSPGASVTLAGKIIGDELRTVISALAEPKPGVLAAIVAAPAPTPVTGTGTLVAPAVNVTVAGTVAAPVLFELRLAVKPAGAGPDRFSVRFPVEPALTVRLPGEKKLLPAPAITTVTPAIAFGIPGALAVSVANPAASPVTGTSTLLVLAPKLAVAGTVATPVLLELRLTVRPPAGAGDDRFRVMFCVPAPLIVRLAGEKLIVSGEPAPTVTSPLAETKPEADAVTIAEPTAMPLTFG